MSKAAASLGAWFERQKRVLPWRDDPSLYRVWISEIMLQQTQVATVVPYFNRFLALFPDVEALAAAPEEEVLRAWAGLGYYSRARNLHRGARQIGSSSRLPRTRDGWLEVPGVGPYTAGAIVSIALDEPAPILDGNVERVLSRVHRVAGEGAKARLWELAAEWVRDGVAAGVRPSALNQALMELGATRCSPKRPDCGECPVASACEARAAGDVEAFPPPRRAKAWIEVSETLQCILDERDRVLVRRRAKGEWREGLWDLPIEVPAFLAAAVGRDPEGEVETRHIVTRHKIRRLTRVWRVAEAPGIPEGEGELRWIPADPGAAPEVAVGSALRRTLSAVSRRAHASEGPRES